MAIKSKPKISDDTSFLDVIEAIAMMLTGGSKSTPEELEKVKMIREGFKTSTPADLESARMTREGFKTSTPADLESARMTREGFKTTTPEGMRKVEQIRAQREPLPAPESSEMGAQKAPMERQMTAEKDPKQAQEADQSVLESLFRSAHGTQFNPKSGSDKQKMEQIKELYAREGNSQLSPSKFALKLYREYDYL